MTEGDSILVERAKAGDKRAFELLVRKYQGRIASVIARNVSNADRVEDLTQEAFLKAYRALGNFRGDSAFYTWLYRIAVNTAKNFHLAAGRTVPVNDVDLDDVEEVAPQLREEDTPESRMLRSELIDSLKKAIEDLSPSMKQAIVLRELEGLSYERIAELMDCPIGTVRSRIFRGRQEIADRLKHYLHTGTWVDR